MLPQVKVESKLLGNSDNLQVPLKTKALQGLAVELDYIKANEAVPFDKLSDADFAVAAAYTTI